MKQITLNIPDHKVPFFMELIQNLGFIKKIETEDEPTKTQILSELKTTLTELKKGKLKTTPAKDFLNEL